MVNELGSLSDVVTNSIRFDPSVLDLSIFGLLRSQSLQNNSLYESIIPYFIICNINIHFLTFPLKNFPRMFKQDVVKLTFSYFRQDKPWAKQGRLLLNWLQKKSGLNLKFLPNPWFPLPACLFIENESMELCIVEHEWEDLELFWNPIHRV